MLINLKEENVAILDVMTTENSESYNYNKALEESTEFSEVLIKLQTKSKKNPKRPDVKEAIGEYGDVVFRGLVALRTLFPDVEMNTLMSMVSDHIDYKLNNLTRYYKEKLYDGGL